MKKKVYNGKCLCGAVSYKVTGPLKFICHDHCSICRKASGAPFVTWTGVESEEDQFELIQGFEYLTKYKSSDHGRREFCSECGTQLFFRSTKTPGEIHLTTSPIQEVLMADKHIFYSEKVEGLDFQDELPKYGGESGFELLD